MGSQSERTTGSECRSGCVLLLERSLEQDIWLKRRKGRKIGLAVAWQTVTPVSALWHCLAYHTRSKSSARLRYECVRHSA